MRRLAKFVPQAYHNSGNCIVLKPAENSPSVALLWAKHLHENLDRSFITVINGGVPETTELLQQKFDQISYTGNGHVARIISEAAAKNLTPCVMELGGKNPVFVDRRIIFHAWYTWFNLSLEPL